MGTWSPRCPGPHRVAGVALMDGVRDEGTNSPALFCSAVRDAHRVPAIPGEGQEGNNGSHSQVSAGTYSRAHRPFVLIAEEDVGCWGLVGTVVLG